VFFSSIKFSSILSCEFTSNFLIIFSSKPKIKSTVMKRKRKQGKSKINKSKQNKTKQNKTEHNKQTKQQNKTKQANKTK
jgi:hypothetical protein